MFNTLLHTENILLLFHFCQNSQVWFFHWKYKYMPGRVCTIYIYKLGFGIYVCFGRVCKLSLVMNFTANLTWHWPKYGQHTVKGLSEIKTKARFELKILKNPDINYSFDIIHNFIFSLFFWSYPVQDQGEKTRPMVHSHL
mgnify:CR=1 FL=1